MKCSFSGCPGEYEERKIVHIVRYRGKVMVIDHVPAEVCTVCGDVLLRPAVIRHIDALLCKKAQPMSTVLLYEYA